MTTKVQELKMQIAALVNKVEDVTRDHGDIRVADAAEVWQAKYRDSVGRYEKLQEVLASAAARHRCEIEALKSRPCFYAPMDITKVSTEALAAELAKRNAKVEDKNAKQNTIHNRIDRALENFAQDKGRPPSRILLGVKEFKELFIFTPKADKYWYNAIPLHEVRIDSMLEIQ